MPRKYSPQIIYVMQPKDIALRDEYLKAKELFNTQRETYHAIRGKYQKNLARLNKIFEPEYERIFDYLATLTPEYLKATPRRQVWLDSKTPYTQAKFGRVAKEYGLIRTTVRTSTGVQARWGR